MTLIKLCKKASITAIDGKAMGLFGRIQITSKELAKYAGKKVSYNIVIEIEDDIKE